MKFSPSLLRIILAVICLIFSACIPRPVVTPPLPSASPSPTASATIPSTTVPPTATPAPPTPSPTPDGLPFPIRAAWFNSSYPEGWLDEDGLVRSRFTPQAGLYSLDDPDTLSRQIQEMQSAGIQAGLILWHTLDNAKNIRLESLFSAAQGSAFHWALSYSPPEDEPLPAEGVLPFLDLLYAAWASNPAYLKVMGRPVLFLDIPAPDCSGLETWILANQARFFLAAAVSDAASSCPQQPDAWYPNLAPAESAASTSDAAVIRPGFWPFDARLEVFRQPSRWQADLVTYFTPDLKFHLIQSFNDWAAGTTVEPAVEWASETGLGAYLDALNGKTESADAPFVLSAAGDISVCDWPFDDQVSDLFHILPGEILTLGDNSNEDGTSEQFQRCFADSWGRFKERIHPSPGNHDYVNPGARAYFDYFGSQAGDPEKGYYSFTRGGWLILSLNSNCHAVGGCYAGSAQEIWLRSELQANPARCTLAYWHQPRWSSGIHGPDETYDAFWRALYEYGAELVLNGNDHQYERFAPQDPDGNPDDTRGIRQFIVGTGGAGTRWVNDPSPNTQVLQTGVNGVLTLTLKPQEYEWQFVPALDESFTDWGSTACH